MQKEVMPTELITIRQFQTVIEIHSTSLREILGTVGLIDLCKLTGQALTALEEQKKQMERKH